MNQNKVLNKGILGLIIRCVFVLLFLVGLNLTYVKTGLFEKDTRQYSRVKYRIDSAFSGGDIIYLGESSNTSFNPWTDTLNQSIGDFLQLYLPDTKVEQVTHEGYHPGLFKKMLNLLDDGLISGKTIVLGVNIRTCGPSAMYNGNEASNQREALFYSRRPALLTRAFMGLHYYDNRNGKEMEGVKFKYWRTRAFDKSFECQYPTALNWIDGIAKIYGDSLPQEIKDMCGAYVKEFSFVIDEENPRVQDLKEIVELCKQKGVKLLFHILPPNREHAGMLFGRLGKDGTIEKGNELLKFMDYNHDFLVAKFKSWKVDFIDNYVLSEAKSHRFTDQWYPTEHYDAVIRRNIAESIFKSVAFKNGKDTSFISQRRHDVSLKLKRNNWPNESIIMPLSEPLIRKWHQNLKN